MTGFTKKPSETFIISLDFSDNMEVGETISSKTLLALDGESDVTSTVIDSSTISGQVVLVRVKAGTDGKVYIISCEVTTSDSNTYKIDHLPMTIQA